jgi:hypothetical protein
MNCSIRVRKSGINKKHVEEEKLLTPDGRITAAGLKKRTVRARLTCVFRAVS